MPSKKRFYGRANRKLKFGKNGRVLCRFCETEVKPPRRTFCSDNCVHSWKLRSNGSYLRNCVFKRDKGICAVCKTDTVALRKVGRRMNLEDYKKYAKSLGMSYKRTTWWDAHHVIAVVEGGGLCDISNILTLCIKCHKLETKKLAKRIAVNKKIKRKAISLPPSSLYDKRNYDLFYPSWSRWPN